LKTTFESRPGGFKTVRHHLTVAPYLQSSIASPVVLAKYEQNWQTAP